MKKLLDTILNRKIHQLRKPYGYDAPDWCNDFLEKFDSIKEEWLVHKRSQNDYIPIDEMSQEQEMLNKDKKWKSLFLYGYGYFNYKELTHFPITSSILKKHKNKLTLVMFSITEAGKHIPPHHGNNHGVLRLQIGVDIPDPEKCTLRVEDKKIQLKEKEIVIFDDTFEHELINNSESNRIVLIIDYYKPLPFGYHILNKMKISRIAKSKYVQSVINKIR